MKPKPITAALSVVAVALLTGSQWYCSPAPQPAAQTENAVAKLMTTDELLARGTYLVNAVGCGDCHSPKKMSPMGPVEDSSRILSGHPANSPLPPLPAGAGKPGGWIMFGPDLTSFVGPWGTSFSANLTPDSTTGLGAWTADQFIATLRTGKHLGQAGGRNILPPMPWEKFSHFTDEDLKAIFTYLQSIPAVHNAVPAPIPPDMAKAGGK